MTKLCPRGKDAAKRKFKVYPSAYANAYASKICAGKIKDPSGVKRKDFRGRKPAMGGGMMKRATYMDGGLMEATARLKREGFKKGTGDKMFTAKLKATKETLEDKTSPMKGQRLFDRMLSKKKEDYEKKKYFKGGRVGLRGGGLCKKGMNRKAVGKNS